MTSMLTLGLVWLVLSVVVALPLGRLLRRADERLAVDMLLTRVHAGVIGDADPGPMAPSGGVA
ncbi:hypothetical protein ACI789_24310 [Geodermatophilus sp. SYSU D00965]